MISHSRLGEFIIADTPGFVAMPRNDEDMERREDFLTWKRDEVRAAMVVLDSVIIFTDERDFLLYLLKWG